MSYLFCFYHTVIISLNQYTKTDRNHSFRLSNTFLPFFEMTFLVLKQICGKLNSLFSVAYSSNSSILLLIIALSVDFCKFDTVFY